MHFIYTALLLTLLAGPAWGQSHDNPVGEKSFDREWQKNEKWATFYDSLTDAEKKQFDLWWRDEIRNRDGFNPVDTSTTQTYKREYRDGLKRWYRDEVTNFEQKRDIQERYDDLRTRRDELKKSPPVDEKTKVRVRVIDEGRNQPRAPRYTTR